MQLSKECPEHNPCCLVRLESAGERDAEVSEVRLEALEPLCGLTRMESTTRSDAVPSELTHVSPILVLRRR